MSADTVTAGSTPAVGAVLAKKYRVERVIGEGGTGIVFGATHLQLEQKVAIKVLRTAVASDEIRLRFEREARAIGKIQSEHVVLLLDVGALDDGTPFFVMEHLEGRDLAMVLKHDGRLPVAEAVDCILQVCEALGEAHANGIVHRDLKPANLFLTRRDDGTPLVKVVDFGISKILDAKLKEDGGPKEVTSAFTVLGSPRYMAPEQLRNSKDVDGRADLWSVGAVLFQLVTGRHAFDGDTNVVASIKILNSEPPPLRELAPDVPPGLDAVVQRCLAKDVAQRWQTASELSAALRPFASARGRDSIERLKLTKATPSERVALYVAGAPPSSRPRVNDIPTAPRAFPPAAPPASQPAMVAPVRRRHVLAPSTTLKIAIAVGGLIAVLVVFGVLTIAKSVAQKVGILRSVQTDELEPTPPRAATTFAPAASPVRREPVVVPLDAAAPRP